MQVSSELIGSGIALTVFAVGLIQYGSAQRGKIYKHINEGCTTKELCDERSGNIESQLKSIDKKLDRVLESNGG